MSAFWEQSLHAEVFGPDLLVDALQLEAHHSTLNLDAAVSAVVSVFKAFCGKTPRFGVHGGTPAEDLALQNIQVNAAESVLRCRQHRSLKSAAIV